MKKKIPGEDSRIFRIQHLPGLAVAVLAFFLFFPNPVFSHERVLRVISPWEIKSVDPSKSGFIFMRMEVTETLTSVDHAGNQSPGLATDWRISADGLQWHFTLRRGVKFHDGTDLTPEAVANALKIALQKPGMLRKAPVKEINYTDRDIIIKQGIQTMPVSEALSESPGCIFPFPYPEKQHG